MKDNDLTTVQTFRGLWPIITPFKRGLLFASIALASYAAIDIAMMWLIKPLLDNGFGQANRGTLCWLALAILLLMLLRGLSQFVANYGLGWVSGQVVMTLRRRLFNHFMSMPVAFFDQQSTGALLSRITYDSEQVASSSSEALTTLVRDGIYIMGSLGVMFCLSWRLSAILLVVVPVVSLMIRLVSGRFRTISKTLQNAMGAVTARAEEMLKGHREVLLFGGQTTESQRFARVSHQMRQQKMKMVVVAAIADPLIQLIASSALAFFLYAATLPGVMEQLTAGTFTLLFGTMLSLMRPLKSLTNVNSQFQQGMAACQTLFAILALPSERDTGEHQLPHTSPDIAFCDVTFRYPTKRTDALKQISFTIPAGNKVALVGRSGSGKSTIAALLTRFYEGQQGSIRLNGRDLREYSLPSLRRQIAVVSQQVHLFNETVANNIAYGCEGHYSRAQIEQAAHQAYVTDFSDTLPQGLETLIGENGVLLSGGQRQRIAIARALLRDSPILILDEATSALDSASEQAIQAALQQLQKNRTTLIIAHRLSTIENADQIVVIEAGSIVECGTHADLLAHDGHYAAWYSMQLGSSGQTC